MRGCKGIAFASVFALVGCGAAMAEAPAAAPASDTGCFASDPLEYKVAIEYHVTFTYPTKGGTDSAPELIQVFESRLEADGNNGHGYEIAEGKQPNLILYITVNDDDSNNHTMSIEVYGLGHAGRLFRLDTTGLYQDAGKMTMDMADQLDSYATGGW